MRLLACAFILLISLVGCSAEVKEPSPEGENKPTKIIVTSVDLFKGDRAKFKPFLGSMSGAFKISYEGSKPNAHLDIDIWEDGKKVSSAGSVGDLFFHPENEANNEIEIIIAVDSISIDGQDQYEEIKINLMGDSGYSFVTLSTPWDEKFRLRGLIHYHESRTFNTDEPIYVWGMQSTSTNSMHTLDFSPESLGKIEKAIIFNLRFERRSFGDVE